MTLGSKYPGHGIWFHPTQEERLISGKSFHNSDGNDFLSLPFISFLWAEQK